MVTNFTSNMRAIKKILDQCHYFDDKNHKSECISLLWTTKKSIISLEVFNFAINISCHANIAVYFLNMCILRFTVF